MSYRIKNWNKFQHFKDRRPPWVKLYRDLMDDPEWFDLDSDSSKVLVMLWLIASEDETQNGQLPSLKTLAFRMRITEPKAKQALTKLGHWVIHDDISVISDGYQVGPPETETETETEKRQRQKAPATLLPDWLDGELWEDFKAHRIASKSKMTPRAEALALADLARLKSEGHNPHEVIKQSIIRGWKGLFAMNGHDHAKGKSRHEQLADKLADLTGQNRRNKPGPEGVIIGTAERVD